MIFMITCQINLTLNLDRFTFDGCDRFARVPRRFMLFPMFQRNMRRFLSLRIKGVPTVIADIRSHLQVYPFNMIKKLSFTHRSVFPLVGFETDIALLQPGFKIDLDVLL